MPLQKLQFRPGTNREGTTLSNEGGWFETDKVRFRSGYPEKIGGWVTDNGTTSSTLQPPANPSPLTPASFWGVCRSMWNWLNLAGYNLLSLGTNLKYYIQNSSGGSFNDITPLRLTHTGVTSAFTTATSTNSSGKTTVTITDAGHGAQANDFVTITPLNTTLNGTITSGATSIVLTSATGFPSAGSIFIGSECITYSGVSTNTLTGCTRGTNGTTAASHTTGVTVYATPNGVLVNGEYQIVTYVSSSQYTILATGTATASSTPAISTTLVYQITTGSDTFTTGVGWGAGAWGGATTGYSSTGWGLSAPAGLGIGIQLRLWSQTNFGENLIFNPRGGPLYYWVVDANPSTFNRAQVLSNSNTNTQSTTGGGSAQWWHADTSCPSICNFVLVSDASRFVLAFGVNDYGSSQQDPLLIRWSDQESVLTWAPTDTNQAGSYRLSQGSQIITALQTRQEILVWTDAAIYSMQYLGAPYVWGFQILGANISIISPNVAVTVNNITYWMGSDKFYMYSGRVETLPCALRQYIYGDINMEQSYQFFGGTNEGFNEIWWFYCSAGSTTIDKYVIYNHLERTWYYGRMERTSWLDSPLRAEPMAAGYGGQLIYQESGIDDGTTNPPSPIDSFAQSSDFDIGDGHNFGFVWRLIPDVTFDGSTAAAPSLNFTVRPRQNPGANYGSSDNPTVTSAQNYSPTPQNPAGQRTYNVQQFTEQVYVRIRGRQMAFRVESNTLGTQWQLGTPRLDVRPDGRR